MKKTILVFGVISGVLSAGMMAATVPFMAALNHGYVGMLFGYATMVLSFLLVYFGIRSYRDNVAGGVITFGKGFLIGISITLISCVFYVVTWEIIYFKFAPHIMDNYGNAAIASLKAQGKSAKEVQDAVDYYANLKQNLKNPLYNSAMTFIEPFPVGLLITLISAAVLRKKATVEVVAA